MKKFFEFLRKIFGGRQKPSPGISVQPVPSADTAHVPVPPVEVKKICKIGLSPGHGGGDTGARGLITDEATLARRVTVELEKRFSRFFDVAVYGMNETKKSYGTRVRASDAREDKYYLPVHFNALPGKPNANGWIVFVNEADYNNSSDLGPLCMKVLEELNKAFRIGFSDWDYERDGFMIGIGRKVYEEYKPKADTVYLELGFISNPGWEKMLTDPETGNFAIMKMADAVVTAFEKFLK